MLKHIAIIFNKEWEDLQRTFLSLANFQVGALGFTQLSGEHKCLNFA